MLEKKYKYDVAFSFLAEDEPIVIKINNLIKGRLKTFIYSEKQEILAGNDGEKVFSDIFGAEARVVIIFYREQWGKTKWTRIEEIAIKNRAYEEGYDFTLFIPSDENLAVPKWLPKMRLWFGIERWGLVATAGVIEAKVQEAGGLIKQETAIDNAALLAQNIAFEKRRRSFLDSEEGVNAGEIEIEKLYDIVCDIAEQFSKQSEDTKCQVTRNQNRLVIFSHGIALDLIWSNMHINTLNDSELTLRYLLGFPKLPGNIVYKEPKILKEYHFSFEFDQMERFGWTKKSSNNFISTKEFADYCMRMFVDEIRNIAIKKHN